MKKVKTKLTISRINCYDEENFIRIALSDENSGDRIFNTDISMEEFANAITNLASRPCETEVLDISNIGLHREIKKFKIPNRVIIDAGYSKKEQAEALTSFLSRDKNYSKEVIEGWKIKDLGLSTQQNNPEYHIITLIRYVENENEN